MIENLRPFQKRFLRAVENPAIQRVVLSLPRANGKSTLAAHAIERILDPDDMLFRPGTESVLVAGSLEQARTVFRVARRGLEQHDGYEFTDAANRISIRHRATHTRLRLIGSNPKTAFGLLDTPYAILDESGAWELAAGEMLWDAIETSQGKPGSPLKIIAVGTLAPFAVEGHWYHSLVTGGSTSTTHVEFLQGNVETWDKWPTIRKANPLTAVSAEFRKQLLSERDSARHDTRLAARFKSFRLNVPSGDESTTLLSRDDFDRALARAIPERQGRPVVAIDLGAGRAWSTAVAAWQSGLVAAIAIAPGLPGLDVQEKRDGVVGGLYRHIADTGALRIAEGLRVQPVAQLIDMVLEEWGRPALIVCDRFREAELRDAGAGLKIEPRVSRWSESTFDIRSLRRMAADGPLAIERDSRLLLIASVNAATVRSDDAGNLRLVKKGSNNQARDDVAESLKLVAGAWQRERNKPKPRGFKYRVA